MIACMNCKWCKTYRSEYVDDKWCIKGSQTRFDPYTGTEVIAEFDFKLTLNKDGNCPCFEQKEISNNSFWDKIKRKITS